MIKTDKIPKIISENDCQIVVEMEGIRISRLKSAARDFIDLEADSIIKQARKHAEK